MRLLAMMLGVAWLPVWAQDVLTQRVDTSRLGVNTSESILSPANVNFSTFGKLFTFGVDGYVYAQPLYVANVSIPGQGVHNVLYVATQHDSVYAFDADGLSTQPLWHVSFINPAAGITTVPSSDLGNYTDIVPEIGITSTPVIDPVAGTLYVAAKTKEVSGATFNYVYRLHALDITTGAERANSPTPPIQAKVPGTGIPNDGQGNVVFDPKWQLQRPGLLLLNNVVYVAFGAHQDFNTWHGWLLGYDSISLQQVTAMCTVPNGSEGLGGIWMAGAGLAADASGNIFVETGNGGFDGISNFGLSVLRLSTAGGLRVADYFTPFNQQSLDSADLDLAAAGLALLPDSTGTHPHILIASGKDGTIYVLDRDNLGHFNSSGDTQIIQELYNVIGGTRINPNSSNRSYVNNNNSTATFWQNRVYFSGTGDYVKMFTFANGLLSTSAVSQSPTKYGFPGSSPSVSSNGSTNGVLWAIEYTGGSSSAVLHAYDATNLANELYNSNQVAGDAPGVGVKFVVATVSNGKVYVGTSSSVSVYGLKTTTPTVAPPSFSPPGGVYTDAQSVSISDATAGATTYYTTDGSTPTTASAVYSTPIGVSTTTTIKAMATATGYANSAVSSATYTIQPVGSVPNYSSGFSATGLALNGYANISGTRLRLTDGGTWEAASAYFNSLVNVQSFTSAFSMQLTNPNADGMTFVIQNSGLTALGPYGGGLGYGPDSPGGTPGIGNSVAIKFDLYNNAGEGTNSTGMYTNGASPTTPALDMSASGVDLHSGDVFNVQVSYDGATLTMTITDASNSAKRFSASWPVNIPGVVGGNTAYVGFTAGTGGLAATQDVLTWTYTSAASPQQNATPTFTPAGGTYNSTQSVTLSDSTAGATIYYTSDGSTPTIPASGTTVQYTGTAIAVTTTGTTIKAIASAPNMQNSAVGSATYTLVTAMPTMSPAPGRYPAAGVSVTLSETTAGASIYYTTDGSTPRYPATGTTQLYTGAITISTTTTIKAIGVTSNFQNSGLVSGTYNIRKK